VLFQTVVAARRSQLELAERLEQRREQLNHAYEESAVAGFLPQRRDEETKDLYYLDSAPPSPGDKKYTPQPLEPLLLSIASTVLRHDGIAPKHRSGLRGSDEAREWCQAGSFPRAKLLLRIDKPEQRCNVLPGEFAGDYHNSWLVSNLPQQVLPALDSRADPLVFVETFLFFGVLIAAFFGLRYAIKRLFALDWEPPTTAWPDVEISPALDLSDPRFGRQAVLLGVPRSEKTEALKHCSGVRYLDLISYTQGWTEDLALGSEEVIVLDHFEYDLDSSLQRDRTLCVLEMLVFEVKCRVVIATTIDPLYYFGQMSKTSDDGLETERWIKVLAGFHVVRATNRSTIGGAPYFALLWQTCSFEERAALRQIAKHVWANCLQEPAVTHLFQRGLLVNESRLEVQGPDFAKYIQDSFRDDHFVIPEQGETADTLSAVRVVFVVAGVAFIAVLAYVWGDQMVAYVATGASALTAATRAFAKSKGRGPIGAGGTDVV